MKKKSSIICFVLTLILLASFMPHVFAETITGSTAVSKTLYVRSNYSGAYIVLSSSTGLVNVAQHNWLGIYKQDGQEHHHGFYKVAGKGPGLNSTFVWAPSATTNESGISTCKEVSINFPDSGDYTITITPLSSSEASKYWRVDYIKNWIYAATWRTTIESGCTISATKRSSDYFSNNDYSNLDSSSNTHNNKLNNLPTLHGMTGEVNSSSNVAVYTGPGTNYYRSASGKAAVGGGESVTIYGRVDDWLLIQYHAMISAKNMSITRVCF